MSNYSYVAVDTGGVEQRGTLEVPSQVEAVRRIREMGLFPTKILAQPVAKPRAEKRFARGASPLVTKRWIATPRWAGRVPPATLAVFTRQTATLIDAGMPLLRGLRILHEQETNRALRAILEDVSESIESGSAYGEALARHPKVFKPLYINMVRAGELSGALDLTLRRLSEFMEKAQRIKGKVKAALFYPCAVLCVATVILVIMMTFIVPRFQEVFDGLLQGKPMPGFTLAVLKVSEVVRHNLWAAGLGLAGGIVTFALAVRNRYGRYLFDRVKLLLPGLGPVFRKLAIARLARTLGTLMGSGVPILQALTIVEQTSGNVVVGKVIANVHERVKEGDPIAPTLKSSGVFPPMVAGMVDVGEQTGALPELLLKVADIYDAEVDDATNAMTSLLEPLLLVFLAIVVGSIVIAMFLPLIRIMIDFDTTPME